MAQIGGKHRAVEYKRAYEIDYVQGVSLADHVGQYEPQQVKDEDLADLPFEKVSASDWGNPVVDLILAIREQGCETYLTDTLMFSPNEIKHARAVGVRAVIDRGVDWCECGCHDIKIDRERLNKRRERGRMLREIEKSKKRV